jgi:hypothetical protein
MARALSATRFDRIHEQYCKTVSRMPIVSKFSNGFGKAVAILDYMGGKEDAFIPDKQEYKYRADAVINEERGRWNTRIYSKIQNIEKTGPEQPQTNLGAYSME